jgi:hypothetical protein
VPTRTRPLFQRVLEMTNQHTGFTLEPPGQEDFTIIQYNPADQYTYVALYCAAWGLSLHFSVL